MQKIPLFQVDAFTDQLFGGNPAAICLLDQWPDDQILQHIASENNLSETAFLVKDHSGYRIRWFTPALEVDLCGHATLAAAHVLFQHADWPHDEIIFQSRSGQLTVTRDRGKLTMDFPADPPALHGEVPGLLESLSIGKGLIYKGKTDLMVVLDSEHAVARLTPDFHQLSKLDVRGVIVTAPGKEVDFVSRFFAPSSGIDEDPVTGSAHCTMTPYWSNRLSKSMLTAVQISPRRGMVQCELVGDRVKLTGSAVTYMVGSISF